MCLCFQGYSTEMDNAELKDLIPPCLVGKKAVLFGNLDAICAFHANVFLKHLESYQETPQLVGSCFVDKVSGKGPSTTPVGTEEEEFYG